MPASVHGSCVATPMCVCVNDNVRWGSIDASSSFTRARGIADQPAAAVVAKLASGPDEVERFLGGRFEGWAAITGAGAAGGAGAGLAAAGEAGPATSAVAAAAGRETVAELQRLPVSQLRKRAQASGAAEADVDAAGDVDEPRTALAALILSRSCK